MFADLASEPNAVILMTVVMGLLIGSFLNVVIYRLPIMMEREWRTQCRELLGTQSEEIVDKDKPFNLVQPRSHCPHCGHLIRAWENIPLLSYLWQRGRCAICHQPISLRYPFIELLSAILAGIVAWHYGFSWILLSSLIFTWALLALSAIDIDHRLLPDSITLPLLWLGIGCNLFHLHTDLQSSVVGAMSGYLSLWIVYILFKLVTGKEGMGFGDFKLLAVLGAWLGWQQLPLIILVSSTAGTIVGVTLILLRKQGKEVPIPFGPFLAGAGWISLLWGETLNETYTIWTYF